MDLSLGFLLKINPAFNGSMLSLLFQSLQNCKDSSYNGEFSF